MRRRTFISLLVSLPVVFIGWGFLNRFWLKANQKLTGKSPKLGINFSGLGSRNTEFPLIDIFKLSGPWLSRKYEDANRLIPSLQVDANGWVPFLEDDDVAIKHIVEREYPIGKYTILYDGEGELALPSTLGTIIDHAPGKLMVDIHDNQQIFILELYRTNPDNYLKNIRIYMPGQNQPEAGQYWTEDFLHRWAGMACLRFMDFMPTNNSKQQLWHERPMIENASYGYRSKGLPLELMVDLANTLNTDGWFCIPHLANDEYIENTLLYIDQHLKPDLKAWVEYSNEVWNGIFDQANYASTSGVIAGLSNDRVEARWLFYAKRSGDIFNKIDKISHGRQRFVKVVASQAANTDSAKAIITFKKLYQQADVLAIAPYIPFNVSPTSQPNEQTVSQWNLDQLFDYLFNQSLTEATRWMQSNQMIAKQYDLPMVAYEGGQHLFPLEGAENNDKLVSLFKQANSDVRMGRLYDLYLQAWEKNSGGLFCAFASVAKWQKHGCWGILQSRNEDPEKSPKFRALMRWAKSKKQAINFNL